jgi:hypothetical protein
MNSKRFTRAGYHEGSILLLVARRYSTLQDVIKELIQNALDANAKKVWVDIDLAAHKVVVRDNGEGASQEDIDAAMDAIGESQKRVQGKLGRFGIGAISPVGQCERYFFTSCPKGTGQIFRTWSLIEADIRETKKGLRFPVRERLDLSGPRKAHIAWRTEALMEGVTTDSQLSRIDLGLLKQQILANFGRVLRRQKAVIEVKLTDSTGKKFEPMTIRYTKSTGTRLPYQRVQQGTVMAGFELIKVDRTPEGYRGEVRFGESGNDFRITLAQFVRNSGTHLSEEARAALSSGLFDGDIVGDAIKLTESRKGFSKNDQLRDFSFAINRWAEEVAKQYMEELKDEKLDLKRQRNGEATMARLRQLFSSDAFAHLLSGFLGHSTYGTQGSGHAQTPGKEVGEQEDRSRAVDGESREDGEKKHSRKEAGEPSTPRDSHVPTTVVGPEGTKRKVVRNDSLGLQFSYYPSSSDKLWDLFPQEGRLNFNVAHPDWAACEDDSDAAVQRLQELITIHALVLYSYDSEDWGAWRELLDLTVHPQIVLSIKKPKNHLRVVEDAAG